MTFLRTLRHGCKGHDVRLVQLFLAGQGLYNSAADSDYGPKTALSVKLYQHYYELDPDGIVGRTTLADMIRRGLPVLAEPEDLPLPPAGLHPITKHQDRQRRWGTIVWADAPTKESPEDIRITNGFEEQYIVRVDCPVFGPKKVRLHKAVVESYLKFMQGILDAGLRKRLLTFDGGFNARYQRGSRSVLSNHAWGSAFDINADWNAMGTTPPFTGDQGCVRELVDIGASLGWYWGGWFKRRDGMHFEKT